MLLLIFFIFFTCASATELGKPKFQVLTPDELMVEVPYCEDKKLVTFRIGVRRVGQNEDDLEFGENDFQSNRVFIYDQRLKLKEGDVVNYLLAYRDKTGYLAQSGQYHFNGVYYKKPYVRRQRTRRHLLLTPSTVETSTDQQENRDTEEFDPAEPRFGGGHHHHRRWPKHHHFNIYRTRPSFPFPSEGPTFVNFHPKRGFPFGHPSGEDNPSFGTPTFGGNCNDHSHDRCHESDNSRFNDLPVSVRKHTEEYHCNLCKALKDATTTEEPNVTTGEDYPDIDIRFADNDTKN